MALNLDAMKAKLDKLNGKGDGKKNFWRPEDGESNIRIVSTPDGDPFKEKFFHYGVGGQSFLCPKRNFGDDCPACNFANQLWNEGTEESKRQAKEMFAKQRFFSPVLVRGEEAEGIRVWGYGKMAYQELLSLVLNPDYGDITDVEEGTDLVLTYGKPAGAQFPQTTLTPRRRSSPLAETEETVQTYLETIPDVDTLFERKTSTQVQEMLDTFLAGEALWILIRREVVKTFQKDKRYNTLWI